LIILFIPFNITSAGTDSSFLKAGQFGSRFLFFLVTHDLYIYLFHRLQHASKILWRTHEAHHSGKEVDFLAGSRSNALEIIINQTIEFAPIIILGATRSYPHQGYA